MDGHPRIVYWLTLSVVVLVSVLGWLVILSSPFVGMGHGWVWGQIIHG